MTTSLWAVRHCLSAYPTFTGDGIARLPRLLSATIWAVKPGLIVFPELSFDADYLHAKSRLSSPAFPGRGVAPAGPGGCRAAQRVRPPADGEGGEPMMRAGRCGEIVEGAATGTTFIDLRSSAILVVLAHLRTRTARRHTIALLLPLPHPHLQGV